MVQPNVSFNVFFKIVTLTGKHKKTHPCHGPAKDALATSKLSQSAPWDLAMRKIL